MVREITVGIILFALGVFVGSRFSKTKTVTVETVSVREVYVPIEKTRVDTVRVPVEIPPERVAIVESERGCVEKVDYRKENVVIQTRWFVPKTSSWVEKTEVIRPPDFWFVETEVGLIGKEPWGQLKFGRTFDHGRYAAFVSGGTLGVGLGVRVRF